MVVVVSRGGGLYGVIRLIAVAIVVLGALAALSCTDYEDRVPVTGKITVSAPAAYYFRRQYRPVDSPPLIHLRTYDWYPNTCYYLLTSTLPESRGRLVVNIGDVVSEGGSCGAGFIQAESLIPLDTAIGRRELILVLGDMSDHYEVIVTPERVELIATDTSFTTPTDSIWWKVPRRSVAMTCQYSDLSFPTLCEDIIDSVFGQPWLTQLDIPSTGVWPYPPNAQVYTYRNESDFAEIKHLLESFPKVPQGEVGGVMVDLLNWRQETYRVRIAGE